MDSEGILVAKSVLLSAVFMKLAFSFGTNSLAGTFELITLDSLGFMVLG